MEKKGRLLFVVQKHKATTLHYDFRLQIGNLMRSWSIPRGPTLDNAVKRLAIPTTDHSLEYRHFDGVIPAGSYGAGTVIIWDEGSYNPELETGRGTRKEVNNAKEAEALALRSYKDGNIKFVLYGKKLHGSFALVRTKGFAGRKESWLLIKHLDRFCKKGYDANDYDLSAASNRSIEEMEKQE